MERTRSYYDAYHGKYRIYFVDGSNVKTNIVRVMRDGEIFTLVDDLGNIYNFRNVVRMVRIQQVINED